jgi:hypothetical protein
VPANPGLERFETRHGVVQVVPRPAGTAGFADLLRDAETMNLGDFSAATVASLAAIVRSKDVVGGGDEHAAVGTLRQSVARAA